MATTYTWGHEEIRIRKAANGFIVDIGGVTYVFRTWKEVSARIKKGLKRVH
jgi:hypothetical protein